MSNPAETLEQALAIIEREVTKLAESSNRLKKNLDRSTAAILTDYVKTLTQVRKDEREQARGEDLAKRSDSDLDKLAKEALSYLQAKEKDDGR